MVKLFPEICSSSHFQFSNLSSAIIQEWGEHQTILTVDKGPPFTACNATPTARSKMAILTTIFLSQANFSQKRIDNIFIDYKTGIITSCTKDVKISCIFLNFTPDKGRFVTFLWFHCVHILQRSLFQFIVSKRYFIVSQNLGTIPTKKIRGALGSGPFVWAGDPLNLYLL